MQPRFDTCVHCIVLLDAGPGVEPHEELRKPAPDSPDGLYRCNTCGTSWSLRPDSGWTRESVAPHPDAPRS